MLDYDRAVVVGEGKVLEDGAPNELLARPMGFFSALYRCDHDGDHDGCHDGNEDGDHDGDHDGCHDGNEDGAMVVMMVIADKRMLSFPRQEKRSS